jgi:hypothetical protein
MEKKNDGGPAFPVYTKDHVAFSGATLRDYFAAKAMQAIISNARALGSAIESGKSRNLDMCDAVSKFSFAYADAMLKARES